MNGSACTVPAVPSSTLHEVGETEFAVALREDVVVLTDVSVAIRAVQCTDARVVRRMRFGDLVIGRAGRSTGRVGLRSGQ